jgi:hypothetical protein
LETLRRHQDATVCRLPNCRFLMPHNGFSAP